MNDELEMIWKESAVGSSRDYIGIYLEGLRKTMKNLSLESHVPVVTRTEHLPHINAALPTDQSVQF
jgi:hypothetical protein